MHIKILGSAAAEGFPAMFCECDTCKRARAEGGHSIRARSQAVIDNTILIDFGPDTMLQTLKGALDLTKVKHILITHAHRDHLDVDDMENRTDSFCTIPDKKPLDVYAGTCSIEMMRERSVKFQEAYTLHEIKPFETFAVGDYTVTSLKAAHAPTTDPVLYLISKDGKTFFYATDTGCFPEETLAYLKENVSHIDAITLDCTAMLNPGWKNAHLGLATCVETIETLKTFGIIDEKTQIYMHHFTHNGGATHSEFVPIAGEHGFGVTYDGMEIEI